MTKFVTDNGLDVLIIDPAYLCLDVGDGAGNLFQVGPKLMVLTEVQHDTGCTVVIIHHNKKSTGDPYGVPELESIAWSGFQEWSRQWLLIGRREAYNPEAAGSHKLWFSVGGSAGHSGLFAVDVEEGSRKDQGGRRWDVGVQNASTAIAETIQQNESAKASREELKAEKRIADDAAKLLKQYRAKPEGDTAKFYREAAGLSGGRSNPAQAKLITDGLIEPATINKNGRDYDGFRCKQLTSGTDRDSTGTSPASPDGEHGGGRTPLRGSPCPAHRDIENSLSEESEDDSESVPVDHETINELFPVGAA